MKTNFNSVVKQKFILKNILLSFNLSLSLENEKIKLDKNPNNSINESENLGKINDSTNEDITSCGSSNNYNSPKISVSEKDPQDNTNKIIPFRKYNSYSINENNNNLNNNSDFNTSISSLLFFISSSILTICLNLSKKNLSILVML